MAKFKITGKVIRTDDHGITTILADSSVVKEAMIADVLKAAWLRDMETVFPQEATADIEYICTVMENPDEGTKGTGEKITTYCCDTMRENLERACDTHTDRFDCPDCLIVRYEDGEHGINEHGIIIHDVSP